jgi:NADH:ubiquinone oxidoreductase subunit 5 (subunit L)/multisubunit Na+/H+ antiporter MnhA subunit
MTIPILILLFPLLSGVFIWIFGNRMLAHVAKVGVIATWVSFLLSAWTLYYVSNEGTIQFDFWTLNSEDSAI